MVRERDPGGALPGADQGGSEEGELERLRLRVQELEETLRAIRAGEIDALVVETRTGQRVFMLEGADRPYRLFVEEMQQGACTLDATGLILYANPRLAAMLSTSVPQLVGRSFPDLVAPRWREPARRLLSPSDSGRREGELRLSAPAGREVPVYLSIGRASGADPIAHCVLTDLTEQKQTARILASAELARTILEQSADVVLLCNTEGRVVRGSRAAIRLCGRDPAGSDFSEVLPIETPDGRPIRLQAILEGEAWQGREVGMTGPDGSARDLLCTAGPLRDPKGRTIGCLVALSDITERMQAERALREADRRKDEFLAMLAHELRNPLAPILHALYILKAPDAGSEHGRAAREIVERQVMQMSRLVDDLLDVSRITRGRVTLHPEPVALDEVVHRAVDTVQPMMDSRRQRLQVTLPHPPLRLVADAARLEQVLSNLLHNASKFTPIGGHVELSGAHEGGLLVLKVRDDGIGIPPEMLPKIFDLFAQGHQSLERSYGGLGIGLTLVRSLVEMHGGTVEAFSSGPGRGSEFVVRLAVPPGSDRTSGEEATGEAPARGPSRRVLVVDDNDDAVTTTTMLLRLAGHEVSSACDGIQALQRIEEFHPQVVLLDIGLPGLDGFEVARRVRARPDGKDIRLVAVTGYGQEEDRRRSRSAGFDRHLLKPVSFQSLQEVLETS